MREAFITNSRVAHALNGVEHGAIITARLCAGAQKSRAKPTRARAKAQRQAARNASRIRPATLGYADFVVVLTTVPAAEMKLAMVLEFYRARWQVELAFERLKSRLEMGQVPKTKESSCRAWMQGENPHCLAH